MRSAASAPAASESAGTRMSHAREPVVAAHLSFPATANSAEGAAIATGVLAFKTLRTEALCRLSSSGLRRASAGPFRTTAGRFRTTAGRFRATAKRRIPTGSRSAAKTTRHRSIGIRNAQPVTGIVRPYI